MKHTMHMCKNINERYLKLVSCVQALPFGPHVRSEAHLNALPHFAIGDWRPLRLLSVRYPEQSTAAVLLEHGGEPLNGGVSCLSNSVHGRKIHEGSLQGFVQEVCKGYWWFGRCHAAVSHTVEDVGT